MDERILSNINENKWKSISEELDQLFISDHPHYLAGNGLGSTH